MAYRNHEGYADPTAGEAMRNLVLDSRLPSCPGKPRAVPRVYVVSRYAGNVERNVADAIRCCRFVIRKGGMPIASHLLYPGILRDDIPNERELGMRFGLALLSLCNEVWIFQDEMGLSSGMAAEEAEAKRLHKVIRYFDLQEVST